MREDVSGFLIDRLAASIVDDSLPLKDVEKELRGCVAEVAVKKRGMGKREVASRCGVTEKSIDNYLKESRANPKSPEREIARILQDEVLSLEEIYEHVRPLLSHGRHFTLDDAKRALEKLIRTCEVEEVPGKRYRGTDRPTICKPMTVEAYRDLVDEKARDLDHIILRQKEVRLDDLKNHGNQHFSRVVGDTNLVRIDFTVDVSEEDLPEFYEKLSEEVARLTLRHEKKKGRARVRILIGMRSMALLFGALLGILLSAPRLDAQGAANSIGKAGRSCEDSWELDNRSAPGYGGGWQQDPQKDPARDDDEAVDPSDSSNSSESSKDRRNFPAIYVRGDANYDAVLDLTDAVSILVYLTQGKALPCEGAGDADGNGKINIADPVALIRFLFLEHGEPTGIGHEVQAGEGSGELPCAALEAER